MKLFKKRRKECKTDYHRRINLLKGEKPRLTFRKSNRYVLTQYVLSKEAQDKVIFGISSKILMKYGWPKEFEGSLKSIPASYLLGYFTAKKIRKDKLQTPIIDFGMTRIVHKNKNFAFLKGLIDAGLDISCDKENFPEEARLHGKNLKEDFSKTFEQIKLKLSKELS